MGTLDRPSGDFSSRLDSSANPFPGLRPFSMEESYLFFGREGQVEEVLQMLSENRFVGIIGPSGSGKSSFVYCGVLPTLYGGFLTNQSSYWKMIVTKPGREPIERLAESLLSVTENKNGEFSNPKSQQAIVAALLRSSSQGLAELLAQIDPSGNTNFLVLVDQFEELFWDRKGNKSGSMNEVLLYINLLLEAASHRGAPIYVAITMRSDFISECAQFANLTEKLNKSHYLIPQMTREQKRRAIEGPLAVRGAHASPRLVQRLLNDLGSNPDQLPILQHALMRTWEYWIREQADLEVAPQPIDLNHYEAVGGMQEALSLHADETFNALTEDQQHICELAFKRITERQGNTTGTRRPTRLAEIIAIVGRPEREVVEVINRFREPGCSLLTPPLSTMLHADSIIDVSHESLMRIWTRLKNWVNEEVEAAQMYIRLAEAAQMYQNGKAGLWRPPDLQLALNWRAKYKPTLTWGRRYHPAFERTMVFLEYSQREFETEQQVKEIEQRRKLSRAKTTAVVLGSLMIVALLFLVYAIYQQTEAKKQETLAKARALEVKKQRDQAQQASKEANNQRYKAEQALIKVSEEKQRADFRTRQAEYLRGVAKEQQKLAEVNAVLAKKSAIEASENACIANRERTVAEQKEREAKRARYIAQSKAMALKSQELSSNRELEALLAQQAYNFNISYKGYAYDRDIYNGLFYALKSYNDPVTKSIESNGKGAARAIVSSGLANSPHIYSGNTDGSIMQWSYKAGEGWSTKKRVGERINQSIFSLAISPDEKYLVAGGVFTLDRGYNYVEIYDINSLSDPPKQVEGYKSSVRDIKFSKKKNGFYALGNAGRSIYYCDLNATKPRAIEVIAIGGGIKVNALAISPSGSILAGAGSDGYLYLWDVENAYELTLIRVGNNPLSAISFSPSDNRILVGDIVGTIRILLEGVTVRELSGHTSAIEALKFNHAGTFVASSSKDSKIRLWDYRNLREQPITLETQDWVWDIAFVLNDSQIIAAINSTKDNLRSIDYSVRIWPTSIRALSNTLCTLVKRNLTHEEWDIFVGEDIPYEPTCPLIRPPVYDKQ